MSLFPAWTELDRIQTVTDAVNWFRVDATVWNLWLAQVGDPQDDLRLLAALPKNAVTGACRIAAQHGAFTALHATQVGLVWRLAKMVMSQRAGLQPQEHVDGDPWESLSSTTPTATMAPSSTGGSGVKERVLKMATLVDQADESELLPPTPLQVDTWTQSYINIMGAPPQEEEEPTGAQLAALNKKLEAGLCPYVDFSVWTPFERRTSRAQKFRVYQPLGDGSYLLRELPGPANLQQWLLCWRVFKAAALMLGAVSLAALQSYEKTVEKLTTQWPNCWGLIARADDTARAEKLERIRRGLLVDEANGRTLPLDWDKARPWTSCFNLLSQDEKYWSEQVRNPAMAWIAAGSRGVAVAPAEAIARSHFPGAGVEDHLDAHAEGQDGVRERKRQSNRERRASKRAKAAREREELAKFRAGSSQGDKGPGGQGSGKGKGKLKSKDQSGEELCYSWASGKGGCASVPPGGHVLARPRGFTSASYAYHRSGSQECGLHGLTPKGEAS